MQRMLENVLAAGEACRGWGDARGRGRGLTEKGSGGRLLPWGFPLRLQTVCEVSVRVRVSSCVGSTQMLGEGEGGDGPVR